MIYNIYKFNFSSPIHIGTGRLESSSYTIMADTLFSALCIEVMSLYGEKEIEKFADLIRNNEILFSDMLPYINDNIFVPKPLLKVNRGENADLSTKKLFKKLKHINIKNIEKYINGELDPQGENLDQLGKASTRIMASSIDEEKSKLGEMLPFNTEIFTFSKNAGLYIMMTAKNENLVKYFEDVLNSLSYSGIGGKRSSGFGRFTFTKEELPHEICKKINNDKGGMLLSCAMAKENELENALENSSYLLSRRGGFSYSPSNNETFRKKDLYVFTAGSFFEKSFSGDIFDVSTKQKHKVYRLAKPMFLEV